MTVLQEAVPSTADNRLGDHEKGRHMVFNVMGVTPMAGRVWARACFRRVAAPALTGVDIQCSVG